MWEERQGGDERWEKEIEREREGGRGGREKLPSLFPQHQLCGFYEEQMFTTWYSASSPSAHYLHYQHHQLSAHTNTHSHSHTRTHTYCLLGKTVIYSGDFFMWMCGGIFTCILRTFYCPFPSTLHILFCSWVNTWYNQVSLPLFSVCTSVGQLWPCDLTQPGSLAKENTQMRAVTVPACKQKLKVHIWVILVVQINNQCLFPD